MLHIINMKSIHSRPLYILQIYISQSDRKYKFMNIPLKHVYIEYTLQLDIGELVPTV